MSLCGCQNEDEEIVRSKKLQVRFYRYCSIPYLILSYHLSFVILFFFKCLNCPLQFIRSPLSYRCKSPSILFFFLTKSYEKRG